MKQIFCTSLLSIIDNVIEHCNETNDPIWYRGQLNSNWNLIPPILRLNYEERETKILFEYINRTKSFNHFKDKSEFEFMTQMALDGGPTRLLDWSENFFYSLFFALEGVNSEDSALFLLNPIKMNSTNPVIGATYKDRLPFIDIDSRFKEYLPSAIEKLNNDTKLLPLAGLPLNSTGWIKDVNTGFVFFHKEKTPLDLRNDSELYLKKIVIPKQCKGQIFGDYQKLRLLPPNKNYVMMNFRNQIYNRGELQ